MNINHVPIEDRYTVSKVRTLQGLCSSRLSLHHWLTLCHAPGFYGVTYALGFRDDFLMDHNLIIDKICTLEARIGANDAAESAKIISEIRAVAKLSTHM